MLSPADTNRLERMKNLYTNYVMSGDNALATETADLLVQCDDPQGVWEEHIKWGEELTGAPCPDKCRDITQTARIKQKLGRLN